MKTIKLFSFGYYGWGNATQKLVKSVDAIEANRGFEPPVFVDIRIRRAVRAKGFSGGAFENLCGKDRYRWMNSLGNQRIVEQDGVGIKIAKPQAANDLLDLAIAAADDSRRVIFFCSCRFPRFEGKTTCHRTTVGGLVLAAAKRRGVRSEIVEWPGGKPQRLSLEVEPKVFRSLVNGGTSVPLGSKSPVVDMDGPPWGSIATLECNGEVICRLVGPAIWHRGAWALQVYGSYWDLEWGLRHYRRESAASRKAYGFEVRKSVK